MDPKDEARRRRREKRREREAIKAQIEAEVSILAALYHYITVSNQFERIHHT